MYEVCNVITISILLKIPAGVFLIVGIPGLVSPDNGRLWCLGGCDVCTLKYMPAFCLTCSVYKQTKLIPQWATTHLWSHLHSCITCPQAFLHTLPCLFITPPSPSPLLPTDWSLFQDLSTHRWPFLTPSVGEFFPGGRAWGGTLALRVVDQEQDIPLHPVVLRPPPGPSPPFLICMQHLTHALQAILYG